MPLHQLSDELATMKFKQKKLDFCTKGCTMAVNRSVIIRSIMTTIFCTSPSHKHSSFLKCIEIEEVKRSKCISNMWSNGRFIPCCDYLKVHPWFMLLNTSQRPKLKGKRHLDHLFDFQFFFVLKNCLMEHILYFSRRQRLHL